MWSFLSNSSLISIPYTTKNYHDSENETLKVQTIQETYPTVIKQSLNVSLFDPSFFNYRSKFLNFFPLDTPLKIEIIFNYHKRNPVQNIACKRITEKSPPVVKTLFITASHFSLDYCRILSNQYIDKILNWQLLRQNLWKILINFHSTLSTNFLLKFQKMLSKWLMLHWWALTLLINVT